MYSDTVRYFFPKVKNRLLQERKRFWKYCDMNHKSMKGYNPFIDATSFKSRLNRMLGIYDKSILKSISDEEREIIITSADQALRHEYDLLGSGPTKLDPIDWHKDFKSGKRWEKLFYREIAFINGADIKVPWELSRGQHLLWLGEAYLLTGETKYPQEIIDEINWWIDDNPYMYSVNWTCAMDVAFRAVNWMFALNMIADYEKYDNHFTERVSQSLWQHGYYIRNNLEKSIPYSNNHYTSDLVGLLYLGELFGESKRGLKWLKHGLKEFYNEIRIQVLSSGVHYERTVSYHRMMTEMLSYPIYMLHRMGENIPQDIIERIGKMYSYVATYTKPNGSSPLIGDNDDGRFVPFLKRQFTNHSYLNNIDSVENRFVTSGVNTLFQGQSEENKICSEAGVAIIKEGGKYLFINGGGYSRNCNTKQMILNTHTHNDALSFELTLSGKDVIVDPGAYMYTSSRQERDSFRSTPKHNTVVVDNEEQNVFIDSFQVYRNINHGKLRLENGSVKCDYTTIKGGLYHKRVYNSQIDAGIQITDIIQKKGQKREAVLYFHFAQGIIPEIVGDTVVLNNGVKVLLSKTPAKLEIIDSTLSPSYGIKVLSKSLKVLYIFDDELIIKTTIKE